MFFAIQPVLPCSTLSTKDPIPKVTIGTHSSLASSAARQNNASEVGSNLKKAVDAEPSYKDMALNDLEFTNYADAVNEAVK